MNRLPFLVLVIALLAACASSGPAPVEDRSLGAPPRRAAAAVVEAVPADGTRYRVVRGDTLYSIAFRNGADYRDLARWNGIGEPYTIYVGQELSLVPGAPASGPAASTAAVASAPARPAGTPPPAAAAGVPGPFETVPDPPRAPAEVPTPTAVPAPEATAAVPVPVPPEPVGVPAAPPGPAAETVAAAPAPAAQTPVVAPPVATNSREGIRWNWPASGAVVGSWVAGDPTRQGIDIGGKSGDPVHAAAPGTVVYSGNGLIGYGELIIIKHSDSLLSAYGHNSRRLVKEGERVTGGQRIAEMGSSSASRDSLHFEIRRNGKPANPLEFLPRR